MAFTSSELILPSHTRGLKANGSIYRVRTGWSSTDDPSDPQSFSYPPPENSKIFRFNKEGESVFYGSRHKLASVLETFENFENRGSAFLSEWIFTTNTPIPIYPFFLYSEKSPYYSHNLTAQDDFRRHHEKYGSYAHAHLQVSYEKMSEAILLDSYPLTSWLAYKYLTEYNLDGVCGISYPSIKSDRILSNLALSTQTVESHMQLKTVYRFRLSTKPLKIDPKLKASKIWLMEVGTNQDGRIDWRSATQEDYKSFIKGIEFLDGRFQND